MTLVVETGSIVAGANTYVSRADYIAYAATEGVTIPDEAAADLELIQAARYLDSLEVRLKGARVERDQPLAYPRSGLTIEGFAWASDEIPRQVILAQMSTALDIHAGIDPYNPPANPERATKREEIDGAVKVEYFGQDGAVKLSRDSTGTALIASLMRSSGLAIVGVRA